MDFSVGTDYVKDQEREEYVCNAVAKGSWAMGRMITMNLPMWDIFPLVQQIKHVRKIIWEDMKPVLFDFLYVSYGIGLTFGMTDVGAQSTQIRKIILVQALLAFLFVTTAISAIASLFTA